MKRYTAVLYKLDQYILGARAESPVTNPDGSEVSITFDAPDDQAAREHLKTLPASQNPDDIWRLMTRRTKEID